MTSRKPVQGYEGFYEVSEEGHVFRIKSLLRHPALKSPLRGSIDSATGYLKVGLGSRGANDRAATKAVHVLVCEAFHGRRPPGMDVCHNDGDKLNNSAENLRWGTRSENNLDAVRHGVNALAAKESCVRGHSLADPNLCRSTSGHRKCRACAHGRAKVQRAKRLGAVLSVDIAADEAYDRIVSGRVKAYVRD